MKKCFFCNKKTIKAHWCHNKILIAIAIPFLSDYMEAREIQKQMNLLEPNVSIEMESNLNLSTITLAIVSANYNGSAIEKLTFYFDIPGRLTNISKETKTGIDDCVIEHRHKSSNYWETTSETVEVTCHGINQRGDYVASIHYNPPTKKVRDITLKDNRTSKITFKIGDLRRLYKT
jgi:hypothetical protein